MEVKRLAVVRLDKIGDLILTTPAISSLKKAFPGCRLTVIASPYNREVLRHSRIVDEIWGWEWSLSSLARLRKGRFDLIAVFSPITKAYFLAFCSGAGIRSGYVYKSRPLVHLLSAVFLNKTLVCAVDQKDLDRRDEVIQHEVEQNLELVKTITGKEPMDDNLDVPVAADALQWAETELPDRDWIGLHYSPVFPREFIESLLNRRKIFVTFGPAEVSEEIFSPGVKVFKNLPFGRWAALIRRAEVFVSANTGALHLAASQHVPVAAVFEPKFFAYHVKRWSPWKVPSLILRKDDPDLSRRLLEGIANLARTQKNICPNLQPQP